jgi:membrane protein
LPGSEPWHQKIHKPKPGKLSYAAPMNLQNMPFLKLLRQAIRRLFADEAMPLAGNIAFRTVFSLFPFLIFLTTVAGFLGNPDLAAKLVDFLLSVAPEQLVRPFAGEITSILTTPRTGLLSLAAALTVWSATAGIDSIRVGLNRAYDLKEHRNMFWLYGQSILFVVGSVIILLAVAFLLIVFPIFYLALAHYAPNLASQFANLAQLRFPLAIILLLIGLILCHRILPAKRLPTRQVLPGVILTIIVWLALAQAFSFYLVNFNSFASTYASLSGIFTAMFFIYLAALVLIFGGEINRVLHVRRTTEPEELPP